VGHPVIRFIIINKINKGLVFTEDEEDNKVSKRQKTDAVIM
jgi:hypothetical protein